MSTATTPEKFAQPCIVELMGHKQLAGHVSEETIAGAALLRIDVPTTAARAGYTKFFGTASVYCITPVSEELMQRAAEQLERYNSPIPIHLPEPAKALPATVPVVEPEGDWGEDFEALGHEDDDGDEY